MLKVFQQASNVLSLDPSEISNSKFEIFKDKPFWIWDVTEHHDEQLATMGNCCFNHVLGLPKKDGISKELFDYEKVVLDLLQYDKCLWILKSTGLGITELFLRYMAWLCLRNNDYQGSQFVIVTGPNWHLSKKLITRMKKLFEPLGIYFDSKETLLNLNNVAIESFPSHHVDSFRSLDNPKFILLDECDFFSKGQQEDVRAVAERYIAKSNPYIVLVSTPNQPGGLMESIEREEEDGTCLYKRIKLDYRYGLAKIYSTEDIEKAKQSPSFDREYDLKYLGKIGNVFSLTDIDKAVELGIKYQDLPINHGCLHPVGIDPGFSSSVTAITVCEIDLENQVVRVILSEEHDKASPSVVADRIFQIHTQIPNCLFFVDSANRGFTNELKSRFGESLTWERSEDVSIYDNYIIPISFQKNHKSMLEWTYNLLSKKKIAIDPKYQKLILSLKSAYGTEFDLDKNITIYSDFLDSLRLSLRGVILRE